MFYGRGYELGPAKVHGGREAMSVYPVSLVEVEIMVGIRLAIMLGIMVGIMVGI